MGISHVDRAFLNLAVDLARQAWRDGDATFGSLLVSADGRILFADRNRTVTDSSPLLHPEFTTAEWAVANLSPQERKDATVTPRASTARCVRRPMVGQGWDASSTPPPQLSWLRGPPRR